MRNFLIRPSMYLASLGIVASILMVSCSWRSPSPHSVVVVLVENLGFGAFACGEGESRRPNGFQAFCDEAVRFTHAYTPSVLSQATLASILTAKYPHEHGVRHNGAQTLSAKEYTVAEAALAKGYRTSFFSGGAPILRRSGLSQGFEVFDDNIPLGSKTLYRSALDVVQLFLQWQKAETSTDKFVSFLYFSDLQFDDLATTTEVGEVRENSDRSQMDTIDESLSALVKGMKARKIWDSSDVILVGLQGGASRQGELAATNLFSETTRTTLMIKPARKVRDGSFNWKIDLNVSIADVGATLFDLLALSPVPASHETSRLISLRPALVGPQPEWSIDRPILCESAWSAWRGLGSIRASVRSGPFLLLNEEGGVLYNTLTDHQEISPLPANDQRTAQLRGELLNLLREKNFLPWSSPAQAVIERYQLAEHLWKEGPVTSELKMRLSELSQRHPKDSVLRSWSAIVALRSSDWLGLKNLVSKERDASRKKRDAASPDEIDFRLLEYVADRNLGIKSSRPFSNPCLSILTGSAVQAKDCAMDGLGELMIMANESLPMNARLRAAESFLRIYSNRVLMSSVASRDQAVGHRWDSADDLAVPDRYEAVLALPEFKKARGWLQAKLAGNNFAAF